MCSRCWRKAKSRDLLIEWDGRLVCPECFDTKHPQLEPTPKIKEHTPLPHTFNEPVDTFLCLTWKWEEQDNTYESLTECSWDKNEEVTESDL